MKAGQVAAVLAERVTLVHVIDEVSQIGVSENSRALVQQAAMDRLQYQREALGLLHRASVGSQVRIGRPAAMLCEEATSQQAMLIVLGAAREKESHLWSEMSTAEEIAEMVEIPTLIVRDATPFLQWLRGDHRLRVFIGADLSLPSESALNWTAWLRNRAPCEIFASFLAGEPALITSDDIVPSMFLDEMVSKAAHVEERLFEEKVRARLGLSHVQIRIGKRSSHPAATLIQLASQVKADVMIVGTHSRRGWSRIGHPSVSRFVLRHAPFNVLVCPERTLRSSESLGRG